MYGKLFAQMYDGTLGTKGPWQALVTFQQLIILADASGCVDMTPEALSRRTTIPLDIIQTGIAELELPDPASRTPDEDGRRIVRLSDDRDWGWKIVNYEKYRKIRSEEERREYHRQYARRRRAKAKESPEVNTSTLRQQSQPIAVSSKQEAESNKQMTTATAREALLSLVPNRRAWEAELTAMEQSMGGHHPASAEEIERAAVEYVCNNDPKDRRFNIRSFVHYVKVVQAPAFTPRGGKDAARDFNAALETWAKESDDA